MTNIAFILGAIFHTISVCLLYSTTFKGSNKYYVVGLSIGLITNSLWLYIAKNSFGPTLYVRGLVWDCIIVGAYTLIPPLVFGIKLTPTVITGCVFIIIGILITKIS